MKRMIRMFWPSGLNLRRLVLGVLLVLMAVLPIIEPLVRQLPVARAALVPNPTSSVASLVECLQPGVNQPGGKSYDSPRFVTTCFSSAWTIENYSQNGDPLLGDANGSDAAILSFGNDTADTAGSEAGHVPEATLSQVGAVYGLANSSGTNPAAPVAMQVQRLFAAAYTKRLTRYGPGGPGAIYALNRSNGSTSLYVQIPGVIPGPSAPQAGPAGFPNTPGDGSSATFANTPLAYSPELGGVHSYQHDATARPLVGRVGLGDIAMDADEHYLYAVNLWRRQIVRIDTWAANPQSTLTVLPDVVGALQPCSSRGGTQNYRPFGLLVTARSLYLGGVCSAESTQNRADLGARVDRYDLNTGTWSNAVGFDLDTFDGQRGTLPGTTIPLPWQPWSTQKSVLFANNSALPYSVPALSGLAVGEDGSMYLGLRDLLGDIGGSYRLADETGRAFGDLLRAPVSGVEGQWLPPSTTTEEFQDSDPNLHNEQTWGALVYQPGTPAGGWPGGTIATTYGAPFRLNSGGAAWYSASGGSTTGREELYFTGQGNTGSEPQTFAKTSGLGDLEPLCPQGGFGDSVWRDRNNNGIQDAGEEGIPGVRLQLLDQQGQVLATVTTDANGKYKFYIPPFVQYQVRIDPTQMGTGPLAGLVPTVPNAGGDAAKDSNADAQGVVQGLVPVKNREHNLTYDIGLVAAVPGVDIRKVGPAQAVAGGQATYTLDYTNSGNVRQAVTVVDDLPAGLTFVSASPPPTSQAGQRLTWANLGPLDPSATGQIQVVVQVDPSAASSVTNVAGITGSQGGQDQDQITTQVLRPNVTVVKDGAATVVAGQTLTYTLRVGNTGTADAGSVTVQDTLPAGTVYMSSQPTASVSGQQLTWSLGTLAPGAQQALQVVVQVQAGAPASLTNTATVITPSPGDTPGDNSSSVDTQVLRADVQVLKRTTATFPVPSGSTITYTLDVVNAGAAPAAGAVLDDTVPPQISSVSWRCMAGCMASGTGNLIHVDLGTLAPGGMVQVLVTGVAQTAQAREGVINTASVGTTTPETDTTNNRSTVVGEVARPDVAVAKDDGRTLVQPGEVLTYTIRLTNTGVLVVPLTTLREVPPAGTTGLARGGWMLQADGSWTQDVGPLAVGAVLTRTFTVQLPIPLPASSITNTVRAELPGGDPTPGDNVGTDVDQVLRGSVGDMIWRDANGDGIQQPSEQGIPGVPVQLLDPLTGRVLATTTTDGQGRYIFPGLPLGSYAVRIDPTAFSGVLKDFTPTTPTAPTGTLTPSQPSDMRLDIGLRPPKTTQVTFAYFRVQAGPDGPAVRWGTLAEQRTKEFRVLRGAALDGAVEIGRVPSVGSLGGDYEVVDRAGSGPGTRYWLVEVERDGTEIMQRTATYGSQVYVPIVRR